MRARVARAKARERRRGGFSLAEATVAIAVLTISAGGLISSLVGSAQISSSNRETSVAQLAARGALERARLTDFSDVFTTYNTSAADDPGGPGTAPGASFAVPGLDPLPHDPDGMPGRLVFPSGDGDPASLLRENLLDPSFSMPRDLNGDGKIDGDDHSADYTLLPVRVVVEWRGARGRERSIEFETFFTER